MREDDGESGVLHVTEHQQRDEEQARQHGHGEQGAVFGRLWTRPAGERQEQEVLGEGGGLTHWTTDTELRPTRSRALKTMKQQTQVKTLSAGGSETFSLRLEGRVSAPRRQLQHQSHMNLTKLRPQTSHDPFRSYTDPR